MKIDHASDGGIRHGARLIGSATTSNRAECRGSARRVSGDTVNRSTGAAHDHQPGQGALPRGRLHEGRRDRLLPGDRAVLLPHLKGRALTMKRYPNGVDGEFFYEKECARAPPDWVPTAPIGARATAATSTTASSTTCRRCVWAANLADLELHTSLARAPHVERPTMMVFDLDPGPPADDRRVLPRSRCCCASGWRGSGSSRFPKTSGSKGLQLYVPLNTPRHLRRHQARSPTALAQLLEARAPEAGRLEHAARSSAHGRVLIDWSQNDEHKTTVCVYSLRARPQPTVSTPLEWDEVERATDDRDPDGWCSTAARARPRGATTATCSRRCSSCSRSCPSPNPAARTRSACRSAPRGRRSAARTPPRC